jgi:hypothetical protein
MKKQSLSLLLAALAYSSSAYADAGYFDVIYAPQMGEMTKAAGFGLYALNDNGIGGYFNGLIPIKPSNYSAGYYCWSSCAEVKTGQAAYVGNIGLTFPLIPSSFEKRGYQSLHAYVGLGYGAIEGMVKYSDGSWTDDPNRDKSGFNGNAGLIVAFDPLSINVGVNSITKAVYLGLGFKTK